MALNGVDATGVSRRVIHAVKGWRDSSLHDDEDNDRHVLVLSMTVNRRDAVYVVECLRQIGNNPRTTVLCFSGNGRISNEAIDIFCGFVRENPLLLALRLAHLPQPQYRRLLEALHTNTSIRQIEVLYLQHDEGGVWIADLLRNRNDLTVLDFWDCRFSISHILGVLRRGLTHLRKLVFDRCAIGDEDTRLLVEALVEGDFPALQELGLDGNHITPIGLRSLSRLNPAVLPNLRKLDIRLNANLLDDPASTWQFIQQILLADDATIKELIIGYCGGCAGYCAIIKACETNRILQVLGIFCSSNNRQLQPIRNQLVLSLPKMKGLQCLSCDAGLFTRDNQPLMMALHQNTSIVEVVAQGETRRHIAPILRRNGHLARVDGLLRPTTTPMSTAAGSQNPTPTILPPRGVWKPVLATVGQGSQGASPVFKILQDRLATWVETSCARNGKKRKREGDK